MAENSLTAFAGKKPLAYALAEENDTDNFLEVDLRQYEDSLTPAQAKELLRELAYWYLYRHKSERGLLHTPGEALDEIRLDYDWLVELSGWKYNNPNLIDKHAEKVAKRIWDESFEGRTKYAAIRFRDRMLQIDRMMPVVEREILSGNLKAVDRFVALARLDMDASGYKAPAKYEFSASKDGELTEADKKQASDAIEDARKFEDELLSGGIVEGQFEDITEEE
jgi:hypothetical protein